MESELTSFDIFNLSKLDGKDKEELLKLFNELKGVSFPSIYEQYATNNEYRRKIDVVLLQILGFQSNQIEHLLNNLYVAISEELMVKG